MTRLSSRSSALKPSAIRELFDQAPKDAINLGLGELKLSLHPFILDAGVKAVQRADITYTPNAGYPPLRAKIAEYYGSESENICVTCGAEEAIFVALGAIIEPGDKVLVPDPGYVAYPNLVRYYGGKPASCIFDPKNDFRLDVAALNNHRDARAMILCNPSNPLGTAISDDERAVILDFCRENDVWLVVDEVYRELYVEARQASFAGADPRCIVVSALSKSHAMTGWRLGWLHAELDVVRAATRIHQYAATCAPKISQDVAIEVFSDAGWQVNRELREALNRNRVLVMERLKEMTILPNHAAPYLFAHVGGSDVDFVRDLMARGVVTVPGSAFGEMGYGWVRITYGLPFEALEKAVGLIQG